VHAIRNARIVTGPGNVIARGTVVMRDGLITAVGANVAIPADARIWEGDSLTLYPGLIDAFVMPPAPAPAGGGARPGGQQATETPRGPVHELTSVRAEYRMVQNLPLDASQLESLRAAGFAAAQVAPRQGVVRGTSVVVGLGTNGANANVVRADVAQVMALEPNRGNQYPGSLMGVIAVLRQVFLDAKWYRDARAAAAKRATTERVPENLAWAALQPVIGGDQPVLMVADEMLEVLQASKIATEAGVSAAIVTGGDEYKRVADVAATKRALIVPVNFPDAPDVSDDAAALEVRTEELRHWQAAPANAATLAKAGVAFSLTANGLKDVKTFRSMVAKAIARGTHRGPGAGGGDHEPGPDARRLRQAGRDRARRDREPHRDARAAVRRDVQGARGVGGRRALRDVQGRDHAEGRVEDRLGPRPARAHRERRQGHHGEARGGCRHDQGDGVRLEAERIRFTMRRGSEPAEDFELVARNDALKGTLSVTNVGQHDVTGVAVKKDERSAKKPEPPVAVPVVMGTPRRGA
jgi:hypothetical protein